MTQARTTPYAGRDRRQRPLTCLEQPSGQMFTLLSAALLCAGLFVPLALAHVMTVSSVQTDFVVLRVLASLLVTAAALMSLIRWRMTGEAALAICGSAFALYGTLGSLPAVLRVSLPMDYTSVLRGVNGVIVVALLVWALLAPTVASRLKPARIMLGSLALALIGYAALYHLTMSSAGLVAERLPIYVETGLTGLWICLAGVALVIGRVRSQPRWTWLGLSLAATGFAEAAQGAALSHPTQWLLASGALRAVAGGVWCLATGRELLVVLSDQGNSLLSLNDSLDVVTARLDQAQLRDEERAHDARAALFAVQAAISTLTGYYDRLESDTRSGLERAVRSELDRLRHMLDGATAGDLVFFDLATAIEPVVTAQRAQGLRIDLQLGSFCWVRGRPADTATVLQTLLENARRHAPGGAVTVRVSRVNGAVVLAVEDQGPGVPVNERASIFDRGIRGAAAAQTPGSGLGLFIASRLMQDQLGEISVRDALGGGACFTLTFAQPDRSRPDNAADDVPDDAADIAPVRQLMSTEPMTA